MTKRQIWILTASVCLSAVFLATVNSSHGALLSPMISHYGLSSSQQGYPNSAQNIGCIAAMFTSLWVIGRLRKQTLQTAAVALMAALMIPLSLLPSFPAYLGLYALVGVAFAYIDAIASSMIADLHPGRNSARMMCVMHACHGLSGIVSPLLLSAALGPSGNMPRAYLTVLAIGVLTLAFLWPANARIRLSEAASRPEPLTRAQLSAFFGDPTLRALAICILFYGIHLSGMIVWIDRYVDVGLQSALGALALAFLYAGMTGSRLLVPLLRIRPLTYICASCLLSAAVLGVGLCVRSAAVMCGCVLLCSLLSGALVPVALGTACAGFASNTLLASTLMNLCMLAGNCVSSPLIGMIEARAGLRWGMSACALALVAAAAAPALRLRAERKAG